ncbi:MAG: MinD/ParA family protein [Anaerolineales bacterium]|nr:MinD/ParA family protein [Anaerolineales bacterium]
MSKIISVHSFRGGTGKSNTTANLAAIFALNGNRVGVVDTDVNSPGIHVLFGMDESQMGNSLNDYLWGKCSIKETAHDVSARLNMPVSGKVFLIPSSIKTGEIARILREGYDVGLLNDGFQDLIEDLNLDYLLIDTHPGINEETLLSIAISDVLALIMRPDQQDFQGTSVTVEVARKLGVPSMYLVINKAPEALDFKKLAADAEKLYNCEVAVILPHSDEMMMLGSAGIFSLQYPDHPVAAIYRKLAAKLMS